MYAGFLRLAPPYRAGLFVSRGSLGQVAGRAFLLALQVGYLAGVLYSCCD